MVRPQCVLAGVIALLAGSGVYATGTHNQGTYVCGDGFEILEPISPSPAAPHGSRKLGPRGNCYIVTGTVSQGTLYLNDVGKTQITLGKCQPGATSAYWSCSGSTFTSQVPGKTLCGVGANQQVNFYVIAAQLLNGQFTFGAGVSIACGGNHGAQIDCTSDRSEPYSTAGDCIEWGYFPSPAGPDVFNTCIRMARADYAGTGWSATRYGTPIQPYKTPPSSDSPDCYPKNSGLEATWDGAGAICVYHRRWPGIIKNLIRIVGLTEQDAKQLVRNTFQFQYQQAGADAGPGPGPGHLPPNVLTCVAGVGDTRLELLRNRSEKYECTTGDQLLVTPCGYCQGGYDPDCPTTCP